jgi:hypothetical protein
VTDGVHDGRWEVMHGRVTTRTDERPGARRILLVALGAVRLCARRTTAEKAVRMLQREDKEGRIGEGKGGEEGTKGRRKRTSFAENPFAQTVLLCSLDGCARDWLAKGRQGGGGQRRGRRHLRAVRARRRRRRKARRAAAVAVAQCLVTLL